MEQEYAHMPSEGFSTCHYQTRSVVPVWRLGLGCSIGPQAMPNLADRPLKRTWEEMGPYSSAVGARLNSSSPHGSLVHRALKHQCNAQYKALQTGTKPDTKAAGCAHSRARGKRSSQCVMEDDPSSQSPKMLYLQICHCAAHYAGMAMRQSHCNAAGSSIIGIA